MKGKVFSGFVLSFCFILFFSLFFTQCKREQQLAQHQPPTATKIADLQNWWKNVKRTNATVEQIISRIPDTSTPSSYWRGQFQNGTPKWSNATAYSINGETIYEVPFQFPDNLVLLDDKPDSPVQPYLSGKSETGASGRTSETFLIVKEQPGREYIAEIMIVVLHNSYIKQLDTLGNPYPSVHLNNIYPAVNDMGSFTGSVKFYDLSGTQILQEGYTNGSIFEYIAFGNTAPNFPITPSPNLPTTRSFQVCSYTYVYQQNCSTDAGCTDWQLISVIFNGCQTISVPDSPPVPYPGVTAGGGGGFTNPPPPSVEIQVPKPHAKLCGNYTWKTVGTAMYCQIRNLGATFVKKNSGIPPQTITLGLVCVQIPKFYANNGHDITEFVNSAYNRAVDEVLRLLNDPNPYLLPGSSAAIEPKFKSLFREYLANQPYMTLYGVSMLYHNGCEGPIPISQPKYCDPVE